MGSFEFSVSRSSFLFSGFCLRGYSLSADLRVLTLSPLSSNIRAGASVFFLFPSLFCRVGLLQPALILFVKRGSLPGSGRLATDFADFFLLILLFDLSYMLILSLFDALFPPPSSSRFYLARPRFMQQQRVRVRVSIRPLRRAFIGSPFRFFLVKDAIQIVGGEHFFFRILSLLVMAQRFIALDAAWSKRCVRRSCRELSG